MERIRIKLVSLSNRWRRGLFIGISIVAMLILCLIATLPLFSTTIEKTETIPFIKESTKDPAIELGDEKIKRKGVNGEMTVTYKVSRSLFDIVFGNNAKKEIKLSSEVTKAQVPEIVANGTRKYQYMFCSNGGYRFYTDEQFKDPNTGFTSKSQDYCAENNQGQKTHLADSASEATAVAAAKPYVPSNCTEIPIPYKTEYQNASWLKTGKRQSLMDGMDGYRVTCTADSSGYKPPDYTIEPINETVYIGTGTTTPAPTAPQPTGNTQARDKCIRNYNSALAQLRLHNATNSSAMSQLQMAHTRCLSAAGY